MVYTSSSKSFYVRQGQSGVPVWAITLGRWLKRAQKKLR